MIIHPKGAAGERPSGCPLFCPGCQGRATTAAQCLAEKEAYAANILSAWRDCITTVHQAPPESRRGYREKVRLAAEWGAAGWAFGFRHRQRLVPVRRCPMHSPRVNVTVNLLTSALPPIDRFPLAYYLQSGGQVTLVVKSRDLPDTGWLDQRVKEKLANTGNQGLWLHLHPAAGRRVTAKTVWHLVWGEPRSTDRQGLVYGPTAFQQLIPELAEAALAEAEAFLVPTGNDFVLDLYCGIGGSLRRWSRHAGKVAGVEIHGESVDCARINAPTATIFRGTGRQRLPQLTALLPPSGGRRLLYVNPPRTGIEPEVLGWIGACFRPQRMACLSCNAVSLKRDLDGLTDAGYRVERILPFDFFPGTRYLELMALLTREKG